MTDEPPRKVARTTGGSMGAEMEWRLAGRGAFKLLLDGYWAATIRPFMTNETPVAGWQVTAEGAWFDTHTREASTLLEAWGHVRALGVEHGVDVPRLPDEAIAVDRVFQL